ncbi:unnamed protein product [Protopolystoma xenopodis]|uniref:Uncharacterized protein n=1 Tax=Protopolystoma xenopodis TaxID=117903 RepID=A0A3S5CFF6_9PLAT|nr:unnamed protein product [Protopolystoma xenopodis]
MRTCPFLTITTKVQSPLGVLVGPGRSRSCSSDVMDVRLIGTSAERTALSVFSSSSSSAAAATDGFNSYKYIVEPVVPGCPHMPNTNGTPM